MNKYEERLLNEWKQHGKIIIAVDFDDTIIGWGMYKDEDKKEFQKRIDLLHNCKSTGAYIVIHTVCNSDRHDFITKYCKDAGLEIDGINTNPIDLPYGKHGKIYANIYLDDRAGINEATWLLESTLYKYRGYLQETTTSQQNHE